MTNPRRVTTKKPETQDQLFNIPEVKLDLGFFVEKGEQKFTPNELAVKLFGDLAPRMTEHEKVYSVMKALESIDLIVPFEIQHDCGCKNTVAVELPKVMKTEGTAKETFRCEIQDYIFEFTRPPHIETLKAGTVADVGLYMLQFLSGTNQGENFNFMSLPVGVILKLVEQFQKEQFTVSFTAETKCSKCKKQIKEDLAFSFEDLTTFINDM